MPQNYDMAQYEQDVQRLENCSRDEFFVEKTKILEQIANEEYDPIMADILFQAINNIGTKFYYA